MLGIDRQRITAGIVTTKGLDSSQETFNPRPCLRTLQSDWGACKEACILRFGQAIRPVAVVAGASVERWTGLADSPTCVCCGVTMVTQPAVKTNLRT